MQMLGYDVRHTVAWPPERQAAFLLAQVARLLSADEAVSPRPAHPAWDLSRHAIQPTGLSRDVVSVQTAPFPGPSVMRLGFALVNSALGSQGRAAWDAYLRGFDPVTLALGPLDPVVPAVPDPRWTLLGHDVCDCGLTSALMNCGYLDASDRALRVAQFAPALNGHHLFAHVEDAARFMADANTRVPEHRPFGVIAIFDVSAAARLGPA